MFLNGQSLGRKKKKEFEYRIRWDEVLYQPGQLKVVTYKNGKNWAEETIKTTSKARKLKATVDRFKIKSDEEDLAFITVKITDYNGLLVPNANNIISFSIDGLGEIIATDNGDPANLISFASHEREAYNGMALVIVRAKKGSKGLIKLTANSNGLRPSSTKIRCL